MNQRNNFQLAQNKQQGSVLLISLMILIVLTLLTFTTSKNVLLQEKMTANARDDMLALQVAEAALAEAESKVTTFTYTATGGADGLYDGECEDDEADCYLNLITDYFSDSTWAKSTPADDALSCGIGGADCTVSGRYIIINLGKVDLSLSNRDEVISIANHYQDQNAKTIGEVTKYKIIAQGQGLNPANKKIVISYYAAAENK